ncbi:MAG: S24 family peptidase [Prevotella sp.]|jgi:phage repressor protein C with HTH and peptisase S24 domain|nr:S24 family peptidase [Prevotella sp.]
MGTILTRISEIANSENITITALEKKIGASKGVLSRALNNNTDIQAKWIQSIVENYPLYSESWLLTGRGEMLKNTYSQDESVSVISEPEPELTIRKLKTDYFDVDKQQIPLYDIQAAAGFTFLFSNQNQQIPLDYIRIPNAPKCDGALYIRGDSMYPLLKSGDIACYKSIQTLDDIRYGEMYLLDIENSSDRYLAVKYIQRSDIGNDYLRLVSENKHHDPRDEHKANIKALALIKATIRYNTIS